MGGLRGNTEDSKEMQNTFNPDSDNGKHHTKKSRVVEVQFGGWLSAM